MKKGMHRLRVCLSLVVILVLFSAMFVLPEGRPVSASTGEGVIAYVLPNDATGDEIHLVNPDGTGDHRIWNTGTPGTTYTREVHSLAWKPDATELAFVSNFQKTCSVFIEDVYAISPDGSNLRRQTAPPGCNPNPRLPTGTVLLDVENYAGFGTFVVYVEGAPAAQFVTLAYGEAKTLTFTGVMDYGDGVPQWAAGKWSDGVYSTATSHVDVLAGKTVSGTLGLTAMDRTWSSPTYNSDGSQMAYILNPYLIYYGDSNNVTPGGVGRRWQPNTMDMAHGPTHLTWIGNADTGKMIYLGYDYDTYKYGIYQADHTSSTLLFQIDMTSVEGMAKLPDNSGVIFSAVQTEYTDLPCVVQHIGNLFVYKFATNTITQITNNTARPNEGDVLCPDGPFFREVTVSPDGKKIAVEYQANGKWDDSLVDLDIWAMNLDGSGVTLLAQGGESPAWSPAAPVVLPAPHNTYLFLPMLSH